MSDWQSTTATTKRLEAANTAPRVERLGREGAGDEETAWEPFCEGYGVRQREEGHSRVDRTKARCSPQSLADPDFLKLLLYF